jgi:hypothetical protein
MLTNFPNTSSPSLLPFVNVNGKIDFREDSLTMLLLSLIQAINEAPDLEVAIAPIVLQICETDWDYGEI